jgi:hypothetical protein
VLHVVESIQRPAIVARHEVAVDFERERRRMMAQLLLHVQKGLAGLSFLSCAAAHPMRIPRWLPPRGV